MLFFLASHGDNQDIATISVTTPLWIHEIQEAYNQDP
jgi:hypothetical protein